MTVDEILAMVGNGLSEEELTTLVDALNDAELDDLESKIEVSDSNGDGNNDTATVDVDDDGVVDKAVVTADSKEEADEGLKEVAKKSEPKVKADKGINPDDLDPSLLEPPASLADDDDDEEEVKTEVKETNFNPGKTDGATISVKEMTRKNLAPTDWPADATEKAYDALSRELQKGVDSVKDREKKYDSTLPSSVTSVLKGLLL